jgi:acyl-CoA reductase-like NAD-dependent aldehyde dehydrogenase
MKEFPNERFDVEGVVQGLRRKHITQEIEAEKAAAKPDPKDWSKSTPEEVDRYLKSLGVFQR